MIGRMVNGVILIWYVGLMKFCLVVFVDDVVFLDVCNVNFENMVVVCGLVCVVCGMLFV